MSTILEHYSSSDLVSRTSIRAGEQRLGQVVSAISPEQWANEDELPFKFVIVGVEEDFGVRANYGRGGAQESYQAFLSYFCNLQTNRFFPSSQVAVLGAVVATSKIPHEQTDLLRSATASNDIVIQGIVQRIIQKGAIPIVIGGGHNNAYGCLSGASLVKGMPIHCLNIDAHTDLRNTEGRHSGNGFTYAMEEGYLGQYFILGVQENYTAEHIWQRIEDHDNIDLASYEDLMSGEEQLEEVFVRIGDHLGKHYGLELDVDVMANFPSSAQSISGFSLDQVRKMIYALDFSPHYFHLCEGRVTNEQEFAQVGRGLALLVSDFVKAHIFSE